jgi:serine/threonine-protein kinase
MIGTTVGKYRVLDRLGRGGMGTVYKALDETLDREVAIKVLNPDLGDAELLKRFRAEAISLARLNHPGIATIYELHRHDDDLLMVMEFVRGETLQALSERLGPLEPPQAAHICIQILDALAHAHRAGIVHRDLKPANVMVTDAGQVKVMDFGIARMLGGEHYTHAGYMMGTPAYMAPEQVLGQEVDGRADLYSVGVLFYRLLSRELPFKADTAIAMAQKQVAEAPTPIGTFRPDLPPWCEAIILRALAKSPDERFQTAEAFRNAIRAGVAPAALGELPTMATPTQASLLRTTDLRAPVTSVSEAVTRTLAMPGTGASAAPPGPPGGGPVTPTPGTPVSSPVERTGTTVVLGRGHLITMGALVLVLVAGIAALGYVALRQGNAPWQSAAPAVGGQVPPGSTDTAPVLEEAPLVAGEAVADQTMKAEPPTPAPATASVRAPETATPASGTAGRAAGPGRKPKPEPGTAERESSAGPAAPAPEIPPAAPAVVVAPIVFDDIKVVVAQGDSLKDRDAVLNLAGDHLTVTERSGETEILSLPYTSIVTAFYSRSKQPRWQGPDGKETSAEVDMGKLGFFRGERNWLIFTTTTGPLFIRFEDRDLQTMLATVQERTGRPIQRSQAR